MTSGNWTLFRPKISPWKWIPARVSLYRRLWSPALQDFSCCALFESAWRIPRKGGKKSPRGRNFSPCTPVFAAGTWPAGRKSFVLGCGKPRGIRGVWQAMCSCLSDPPWGEPKSKNTPEDSNGQEGHSTEEGEETDGREVAGWSPIASRRLPPGRVSRRDYRYSRAIPAGMALFFANPASFWAPARTSNHVTARGYKSPTAVIDISRPLPPSFPVLLGLTKKPGGEKSPGQGEISPLALECSREFS